MLSSKDLILLLMSVAVVFARHKKQVAPPVQGDRHHSSNLNETISYKVEQIQSAPLSNLGEGPHWDSDRQSLFYNDIYGGYLRRYDFATDQTYSCTIDGVSVLGFIIPVEGNQQQFVVGSGTNVLLIQWDGQSPKAQLVKVIQEVEKDKFSTRFNDAKADPRGRLFAGTMRLAECGDIFAARWGTFYRYTNATGFVPIKTHIGVSNGLCWNEQKNKFYYIDSCALDVKEFDYDPDTGNISNERVVINLDDGNRPPSFVPDGMTIDTQGNLYVATWGGSRVLKINPSSGKIELEIKIPAEQVTSVAFGGPHLDILFVTTAGRETKELQPPPPPAGGLFKVTGLGVTGTKMYAVNLK